MRGTIQAVDDSRGTTLIAQITLAYHYHSSLFPSDTFTVIVAKDL
jgi:hypothetical protein